MTKIQFARGVRRAKNAFVSDSMIFFVVYLAILGGIPIIVDPATFAPASVYSELSAWLARVWGVDLVMGGVLCGFGLIGEKLRYERAGLACLFTGALIYGLAIVIYGGLATMLPFLTYIFFAMAALARYRKLGKILQGIEYARNLDDRGRQC